MAEASIMGRAARYEARMRSEGAILADRTYNMVLGGVLTAGLALTAAVTAFAPPLFANLGINPLIVIIAYVVIAIGASLAINKSSNPAVSGLGFFFLSAATGALLSFVVARFDASAIQAALLLTGAITAAMVLLSVAFPSFFLSLGKVLFISLLLNIVVGLVSVFVFRANLGFMPYVGAGIFSLYIGYDYAKSQAYPKTVDNAIDSAADIYLDIVNLFMKILEIMGKRND